MTRPVRVLVVDGSSAARRELADVLETDAGIRVVGCVDSGRAALEFLGREKPDIVVMDIHMHGTDGYEATRAIMESLPLPIVLCSAPDQPEDVATTFRAFEAGAVAVVARPQPLSAEFEQRAAEMRRMVRLMSEVKVVRRWPKRRTSATPTPTAPLPRHPFGAVGIGASTGGPPALQTLLAGLPKDFALPILVVQHITRGFLPGLADWLGQTTPLHVQIAAHDMEPRPGHVYLAPDDFHMELGESHRIRLTREAPENSLRPSVDRLFRSLAQQCGARGIGVLLTGMGKDGARGLLAMREAGAWTIAQDEATCTVFGMPREAIALGAAREVLPLDAIGAAVFEGLAGRRGVRA